MASKKAAFRFRHFALDLASIRGQKVKTPNRLDDFETFVEFKTLASLAMTPNSRAQQVQSNTEKRAHDLDLKYPGSTFTQALKSHGKDCRYLVLVVGPFCQSF